MSVDSLIREAIKLVPEEVKEYLCDQVVKWTSYVDKEVLADFKPCQIVLLTVVVMYVAMWLYAVGKAFIGFVTNTAKVKTKLFRLMCYIPQVQERIDKETEKLMNDCTNKFRKLRKDTITVLPEQGLAQSQILETVRTQAGDSKKFYMDKGNISGAVYVNDESHWGFIADVIRETMVTNPLHIDEFLWLTQMEAEVIRWTLDLYNGDKDTCGIMTSGGTESIMLAMLAYRVQGLKERGVTRPNIVCSETAHCAFDKAGFYFGIEVRRVPMAKDTFLADFEGMKKAVDSNTVCLVASSPEYAFGNFDPVEKIAALAQSWGIGCHSDCCLGSYINPFIEELGYPLAHLFDFRVEGVTTISCDPHKYGYGPKGASILMFRSKKLRQHQLYVNSEWNGGIYATTCMAGSRPGSVIAGTWASMLKHGKEGYRQKAKGILEAQKQIALAFKDDPNIEVASKHSGPTFSFTSKTVNAIAIGEQMLIRGNWTIAKLQRPAAGHIGITDANQGNWKHFVSTLRECVIAMKADPSLNVNHDTALYGISGAVPDKALLRDFVCMHQSAMLDTLN